jgi:hypothetical protein
MAYEDFRGKRQRDDYPEGVSEEAKAALESAVKACLKTCPRGAELWIIHRYCCDNLSEQQWSRGCILDWQFACVERALRAVSAGNVYVLPEAPNCAPRRPTLESLTAALRCPECGATASQVVRRSVLSRTSPVLRVMARSVRVGVESLLQHLEPEPLPSMLRCEAGHQYPMPVGMEDLLRVE